MIKFLLIMVLYKQLNQFHKKLEIYIRLPGIYLKKLLLINVLLEVNIYVNHNQ